MGDVDWNFGIDILKYIYAQRPIPTTTTITFDEEVFPGDGHFHLTTSDWNSPFRKHQRNDHPPSYRGECTFATENNAYLARILLKLALSNKATFNIKTNGVLFGTYKFDLTGFKPFATQIENDRRIRAEKYMASFNDMFDLYMTTNNTPYLLHNTHRSRCFKSGRIDISTSGKKWKRYLADTYSVDEGTNFNKKAYLHFGYYDIRAPHVSYTFEIDILKNNLTNELHKSFQVTFKFDDGVAYTNDWCMHHNVLRCTNPDIAKGQPPFQRGIYSLAPLYHKETCDVIQKLVRSNWLNVRIMADGKYFDEYNFETSGYRPMADDTDEYLKHYRGINKECFQSEERMRQRRMQNKSNAHKLMLRRKATPKK